MADAISGLTCYIFNDSPPHVRVQWIAWNSPFRATDLRIGDRIVAINGVALNPETFLKNSSQLPGAYAESAGFAAAGLTPGSVLSLRVHRRCPPQGWVEVDINAPLYADAGPVLNDNKRLLIAAGGPESYQTDGFDSGNWLGWYEKFVDKLSALFDRDAQHMSAGFNSRYEYTKLKEENGARVELAASNYPCDWSRILQADYDAALALMRGEAIDMPPAALAFRQRGDELVERLRQLALQAWQDIQQQCDAETIPAFPAINPVRDIVDTVKDKLVLLPPLGNRDYLNDTGRTIFAAGSGGDGWYFIDAEADAAQAMLIAQRRYARLVAPNLGARWEFLARITGDARLAVIGETAHYGLQAEPIAALVGGAMFVDLRSAQGNSVMFAGEEQLHGDAVVLPQDSAAPAQVMEALLSAVKNNDLPLWRALHADWWIEDLGNGQRRIHPHAARPDDSYFEQSRRLMAKRLADARTAWVSEVRTIAAAERFPGAKAIEEVELWYDNIGDVSDAEGAPDYRTFMHGQVTSTWWLQRLGDGPWRVVGGHNI